MSFFSRFTGVTCPRAGCGHKNPKAAEDCERCGVPMALRRPAILEENRWSAADDELAVFFKFKQLKGWLTKNFTVPPGMCAWVMAGEGGSLQVVESLSEGTHTAETFLERMNTFFRGKPGEVLILRMAALPLAFEFDNIFCAELLPLRVALHLPVRVVEPLSFRRHFMLQEGAVTRTLLQDLLRQPLQAALAEALGKRELQKMVADPDLRQALGDEVRARMQPQLREWGLDLQPLHGLDVWHEAFDEHRRKKGEIWLATQEASLQAEQVRQASAEQASAQKRLEELYDQEAWAQVKKREAELSRSKALDGLEAQDQALKRAQDARRRAERAYILQADTYEAALAMGAANELAALKAQYLDKHREREKAALQAAYKDSTDEEQWQHYQAMARIANDSDQALEKQLAAQEMTLLKLDFEATLQEHAIAQARALAQADRDETLSDAQHEQQVDELAQQAARTRLVKDTQARIEAEQAELVAEMKARDALRVAQWEDAAIASKINRLASDDAAYDKTKKLEGLEWLSDIIMKRKAQKLELVLKETIERQRLEQIKLDQQIERDIRVRKQQLEEDLKKGELGIQKMRVAGSLPPGALVASAESQEQISSLTAIALVDIYKTMSPEQIRAAGAASGLAQAAQPVPASALFAAAPPPSGPSAAELAEAIAKSMKQDIGQTYQGFIDQQARSQAAHNDLMRHAMDLLAKGQENTANAIGRQAAAPVHVSVQAQAPVAMPMPPQVSAQAVVHPQAAWATAAQPLAPSFMASAQAQAGGAPASHPAQAVAARACPNCQTPVHPTDTRCPACFRQL